MEKKYFKPIELILLIVILFVKMSESSVITKENIVKHASEKRGYADHGWLKSYHTFSFAEYYNSKMQSFGPLRVINEDSVAAGEGFPPHPHSNFEIFSYVLSGALKHRDSMGNEEIIHAGGVQFTSAGKGIFHSEFNAHKHGPPVKFLQIWVKPDTSNLKPTYESKEFPVEERTNAFKLILSQDGREDSIKINQDINVLAFVLTEGHQLTYEIPAGRRAYLHSIVADATLRLNDVDLKGGDGAFIYSSGILQFDAIRGRSEFLLFEINASSL